MYSDLAISVCLTLGMVYKQPLRQTEGLVRGLLRIMGLDLPVPRASTFLRRGSGLTRSMKSEVQRSGPIDLVVDSTGLKIFCEGALSAACCACACRVRNGCTTSMKQRPNAKSWRKLHLGVDLTTGDIICSDLTLDDVDDPTALPGLLDQIEDPVSRFLADGAYDGKPTSDLLKARLGDAVEIIIPPPRNSVLTPNSLADPSSRDRHMAQIRTQGRLAWQANSGYNQTKSRGRANWAVGKE